MATADASSTFNGTLDSFVVSSKPHHRPIAESQEVRDRGSLFSALIFRATSPSDVLSCVKHVKHVIHGSKPATHEISAWRCMVLKKGKTGLTGPDDFEIQSGSADDGEKWAGEKILKVMEANSIIDAVIVVSRWYGGVMLGPARFSHIETCSLEVCRVFKRREEIDDCTSTLTTLDALIAQLRSELKDISPQQSTASTSRPVRGHEGKITTDYSWVESDISKAKRNITAKENTITTLKKIIAKRREEMVPDNT